MYVQLSTLLLKISRRERRTASTPCTLNIKALIKNESPTIILLLTYFSRQTFGVYVLWYRWQYNSLHKIRDCCLIISTIWVIYWHISIINGTEQPGGSKLSNKPKYSKFCSLLLTKNCNIYLHSLPRLIGQVHRTSINVHCWLGATFGERSTKK